jgi:SAM-dependent methyltransferase
MTDWLRIENPVERLHGFASGFHATYYVYTGVECGLFEALVDPRTPSELASQLDLHEPYVRHFCEVGLRWGLLTVESDDDNDEYTEAGGSEGGDTPVTFHLCEEFVSPLAVPESAQYMGHLFEFAAVHLSEDYVDYPEYFQSGETRGFTDRNAAFTDVIEGNTRGLQTIFVEKLIPESLPAFESRLSRSGQILDIGCGTGHLACRLCERYPNLDVTGIDLDADAIEQARTRADALDIGDRTSFHVTDAASISVESPDVFDAIVLFMSLHEISPESREAMFERLGKMIREDGVVAVFDEVYPERPVEYDRHPFTNGVETQWSELIWGNDVPTATEQRDLLATADLEELSRTTFAERFVVYEGGPQS